MQAVQRIVNMLDRLEAQIRVRYSPQLTKELVFNRVRVLRSEGYADDVALAMSMKEHNLNP